MSLFYEHLLARYDVKEYGEISFIGKLKELSSKSDIVKRSCKFIDFGVIVGSGTIEEYYLALPLPPIFKKMDGESLEGFVYRVEYTITDGNFLLSNRIKKLYRDAKASLEEKLVNEKISPQELFSILYSKESLDTYVLTPLEIGKDIMLFIGEFGVVLDINKRLQYIYPFKIEGVDKEMVVNAKYSKLIDGRINVTICNILFGETGNYIERLEPYKNIQISYRNITIKFMNPIIVYGTMSIIDGLDIVLHNEHSKGCYIRIMSQDLDSTSKIYEFLLYDYLVIKLFYKRGSFFFGDRSKNKKYENFINITECLTEGKVYNVHISNNQVVGASVETISADKLKHIERMSIISKGYKGTENTDVILMKQSGMEKYYKKVIIEKLLKFIFKDKEDILIVNKLTDIRLEGTIRKFIELNGTIYIAKITDRIVNILTEVKTIYDLLVEFNLHHIIVNNSVTRLKDIIIGKIEKEDNIIDLW
eukprot:TRINITY_DN1538_c0_g1_i1.p1 TRINITY_DN1538_c0_g1~~TRINITY_DN1538_c0_g1_i1.p1  ORF type:complete len:476 (-),score=64.43 TRINITY_DN1538_c0_g1_i1:7-1434(-)